MPSGQKMISPLLSRKGLFSTSTVIVSVERCCVVTVISYLTRRGFIMASYSGEHVYELRFVFFGHGKMDPANLLGILDIEGCFDKMLLQCGSGMPGIAVKF